MYSQNKLKKKNIKLPRITAISLNKKKIFVKNMETYVHKIKACSALVFKVRNKLFRECNQGYWLQPKQHYCEIQSGYHDFSEWFHGVHIRISFNG